MKNIHFKPLDEASRVSVSDTIIFTDKTPKSLFEYYINGYTEKDILTLIENLRMDFDTWDKTYNFYRSSNAIAELSSDDIAVLYEDARNNAFIYSFATKRIYYYDKETAPYIDINNGMNIAEFLLCAKRDFEALLRTPYGKKYVTEASVVFEGIKEVLYFGKALRIYIDGRGVKDNNIFAIDEHTWACVDALVRYQDKMLTESEYDKICGRKTTVLQVFQNSAITGHRDALRRRKVGNLEPQEQVVCSFGDIMKRFNQDPETVWNDYQNAKSFQLTIKEAKPKLEAYFKKNPVISNCFKKALSHVDDEDIISFDSAIKNCMIVLSPFYGNKIAVFDMGIFKRDYLGHMKDRYGRFNNSDIHQRFLFYIDQIINILTVSDKSHSWKFRASFNVTKNEAEQNCTGLCYIHADYLYLDSEDTYEYKYDDNDYLVKGNPKPLVKLELFESLMGMDYETWQQHKLKESFGVDDFVEDDDDIRDQFLSTEDENIDLESAECRDQICNIFNIVFEEAEQNDDRSTQRKLAHGIRSGVEKLGRMFNDAKRIAKDFTDPMGKKLRDFVDGLKDAGKESKREEIISGSLYLKLRNFFVHYVLPAAAIKYTLGPFKLFLIGIGYLIVKPSNNDVRDEVVRELETELKLTREKIEDARSDGNRKAKYNLMRIESKLESEIARVKYNADGK